MVPTSALSTCLICVTTFGNKGGGERGPSMGNKQGLPVATDAKFQ